MKSGGTSETISQFLVALEWAKKKLSGDRWKKHFVCTPCGTCLEMFLELFVDQNLDKLKFICGSWDLKRVLVADLDELFPQFGKGGWPYETKGVR